MNRNKRHTPGPWTIGFAGHIYQDAGEGKADPLVLEVWPAESTHGKEAMFNLKLVAAAPELLATLIELRDMKHYDARGCRKDSRTSLTQTSGSIGQS